MARQEQQHEQVNILLVDDQPGKLLTYETILGDLGENLIKANSGTEALDHLLRSDVAVVLVDVCMPMLDGFELAAMIREHPRFQKTAIILVSAVAMTDLDRLRGYDSGAVDYVSVPIIPEVLRAKVSVFADLYRKTQQLHRLNRDLEQRVSERTAALEASTAELRESEERFRNMANHAPMMVWMTDQLGSCTFLSNSWYEFTGEGGTSKSRLTRLDSLHPDDRRKVELAFESATAKREVIRVEYRLLRWDRQYRWMMDSAAPRFAASGEFLGYIGSVIDITDRKTMEDERDSLLQSERAARNDAERATRLKDDFVATLSHELRTPLNSIQGWAQLLLRGSSSRADLRKGLEVIERNARMQSRLVDDLFEMHSIIQGKSRLDVQSIDLLKVVDAAIETVKPNAEVKKVELVRVGSPEGTYVKGDSRRLQQVLCNLLSNAIKFTPAKGRVDVSVERMGDDIQVQVKDTGQGIKGEFIPFVFDRFRQGDSSPTRKHGGLGLGLTIVKHLTELHGGTVSVESSGENMGATFSIRLPADISQDLRVISRQNAEAEPVKEVGFPSLKGLRILAVDDEPDARSLIHRVLEESEAQVLTAASAQEALILLQGQPLDLLVCDISMPGMDGYELIKAVRAMHFKKISQIPAVALTAFARLEDQMRALEAGYQVHLAKPIEPLKFLSALKHLTQSSKQAPPRKTRGRSKQARGAV